MKAGWIAINGVILLGIMQKCCFMGRKYRCFHGMMKAQDAAVLAERIDAQLVIPFHYGVLPGGVTLKNC